MSNTPSNTLAFRPTKNGSGRAFPLPKSRNGHALPATKNGAVIAVGTAFPEKVYTQAEVKEHFGLNNRVVNKLLDSGHIQTRHLYLPDVDEGTGRFHTETPVDLNAKFLRGVEEIGARAATNALGRAGVAAEDIDSIVAVTSTGLAVPGVSSMLMRTLGLKESLHRLDVVGMGCNAGMSALYSAATSVAADPNLTVLMVCVEINSAIYVVDETIRTGIVNSLFGDGAAAIVLQGAKAFADRQANGCEPSMPAFTILDFESFTAPSQWDAMRFDWNESQNKWSFFLSKDIPFFIGEHMKYPVNRLLERTRIAKEQISHWVLHTGGAAVIDGAKSSIGLNEDQVRHTRSVLRDYGNLSSGSFLVSLDRFYNEGCVHSGEFGMLIAMGPGATIEVALVRWL